MSPAHIFSLLTIQKTHNLFRIPVNLQSVIKILTAPHVRIRTVLGLRRAYGDYHRCRQINCEDSIDFSINNNLLPEVKLFPHIQLKLMWH